MPIHFIDNYPRFNLDSCICRPDRSPLYGEIWLYQELMDFNDNGFLKDENWYVKHNYNLSSHPFSEKKVEGQIDFLILSKYGILIIEVKGGAIEIDQNDVFYSYETKNREQRYVAQNPFNQVKEYVHSLRSLLDSSPFIYRAVIFPHESNFKLKGPQLSAYNYLFFSKADLNNRDSSRGKNDLFFSFLTDLAKDSRRTIIQQLYGNISKDRIDGKIWDNFPLLNKREVDRLRSELFPQQTSHGFDPEKIQNEILLQENYEILKGLRKNRKVMVEGGPGTGKTVLAVKFLAENLIKHRYGIYFCANKLLRAKMRHLVVEEYNLDPNFIQFHIYHPDNYSNLFSHHIDFIIIDEAQEFFDKGLDIMIEKLEKLDRPKFLILYDSEQAIMQNFKDIDWYADFLLDSSFVHYLFGTTWRCTQNKEILEGAQLLMSGHYSRLLKEHKHHLSIVNEMTALLAAIKGVVSTAESEPWKWMILVESQLIQSFGEIIKDYFTKYIEEVTESNINIKTVKVRYTTPIKFRGLESENVVLVTSGFNDRTKVENYIAITRSIYDFKCIIWN